MAEKPGTRELRQVREERWHAHPVLAGLVRAVVLLVPLLVGVASGLFVAGLISPGLGLWRLMMILAASTAAIVVTERVARRLLPLAMLLRLSLVFPDRAPARVRIALRAGNVRRLRRWAEQERDADAPVDAGCAAERLLSLVTALGAHDRRTRGHSERVRALVEVLGEEMELEPGEIDKLRWAGLLHDLGKLSVPTMILNKPAKPTAEEWAVLRRHPADGIRLAGPLVDWLGEWAHGIDEHHERWDGDGYPYGRSGADISMAGRIVAVADAFECMTEVRSYQRPRSYADARTELSRCAGSQFDPAVVRALDTMSLPRLHWLLGPVSWLAQVPFLGTVPRTGVELANFASAATISTVAQVATAAALLASPASAGVLATVAPPASPASVPAAMTLGRDGSGAVGGARQAAESRLDRMVTATDTTDLTAASRSTADGDPTDPGDPESSASPGADAARSSRAAEPTPSGGAPADVPANDHAAERSNGTPAGAPDGTPHGPPAGTPHGPPAGTPNGPPAGVPANPHGPPAGVGAPGH